MIYRIQGSGAFVKEQKIQYSLNFHTNFTESMFYVDYLPCIRFLSSKIITPTEKLANLLQTSVKNSVLEIKVFRAASPTMSDSTNIPSMHPLCVSFSYLLSEKFPDLPVLIYKAHSLYSLLQKSYGIKPCRIHTQIETEGASKEDVKLLAVSPQAPILVTKSLVRDQYDYLFEYTISRFRGDRFSLEISY